MHLSFLFLFLPQYATGISVIYLPQRHWSRSLDQRATDNTVSHILLLLPSTGARIIIDTPRSRS